MSRPCLASIPGHTHEDPSLSWRVPTRPPEVSTTPVAAGAPHSSLPALTLLTWDEFKACNGSAPSDNSLGLSDDEMHGGDESDDDDFGSNMSDDDMVPMSLFKATCVPSFAVDTSDSPRTVEASSPSMPSTSLEECINTPTFALVLQHEYLAHTSQAPHSPAHTPQQAHATAPTTVWRDDSGASGDGSSTARSSPQPTPHAAAGRRGRSPKSQSTRRKRKNKSVAANDEHNAAAAVKACAQPGPNSAVIKRPLVSVGNGNTKKKQPRHPLQPKVPNAPVTEVVRSVTA